MHKPDLLVGKRSDLLTVDAEGSNELAILEHGNCYERPSPAEISRGAPLRIAFEIGSLGPHIRNVDRLLRRNNSFQRCSGERQPRAGKQIFDKSRWHTELGYCVKLAVCVSEHSAELGIANPRSLHQHRLEDRLHISGRAADHLEHLRGGGLLLQGFS